MVDHHTPRCQVKILYGCFWGQGHSRHLKSALMLIRKIWNTGSFVAKLGVVIHSSHTGVLCKKISVAMFTVKVAVMVDHHKLKWHMKILDCNIGLLCQVKVTAAHIQISLNVFVDIWSTTIWSKHGMVVHRHNSECHAHACSRTHTHTFSASSVWVHWPSTSRLPLIPAQAHQDTVLFSVCVTETLGTVWHRINDVSLSDVIQGEKTHGFFVKSIMMLSEPLWKFCTGMRSTARPKTFFS